jgi:hypothetical protein
MNRIEGIIIPAAWDSDGNITSLAIATGDEEEYLIEDHQQVDNLWNLLRQEVVAVGSIKCSKERKIIKVTKICAEETSSHRRS